MYIEITISATEWSFQRKDESGANIGSPDEYDINDYDIKDDVAHQAYFVYASEKPNKAFPPVAIYPFGKTILITAP